MRVSQDRPYPPYNPAMLRWARDMAGVSVEDAAKRASVNPAAVIEWESDARNEVPTPRQARELAQFYGVSFLEFFRSTIPLLPEPTEIPDFRLFPSVADPSTERELSRILLWAEVQRANALDLYAELGEDPPRIDHALFVSLEQRPEDAAALIRRAIDFPIQDQVNRNEEGRRRIGDDLRRKIEALGVLTFRRTDLKKVRVRGLCVWQQPLPIIVIGADAPAAQAFTIAHEVAHVFLRQSAISGVLPRQGGDPSKRRVEEWCNQFASAFLIPSAAVRDFLNADKPPRPARSFDDETLRRVARYFGVSEHAMLIRLVNLQYVAEEFYWGVKKPLFDSIEANARTFGRPKYYGTRYRGRQGDLYTGLVLEAWSTGRLSGHHAAEYMGIKNIQHMFDIREHFRDG